MFTLVIFLDVFFITLFKTILFLRSLLLLKKKIKYLMCFGINHRYKKYIFIYTIYHILLEKFCKFTIIIALFSIDRSKK